MNLAVFFSVLGLGGVAALYASWRYSRKGIHPRFYPHFGLVAMVFMILMGAVAIISFVISRLVGNEDPPVRLPVTPLENQAKPTAPEVENAAP